MTPSLIPVFNGRIQYECQQHGTQGFGKFLLISGSCKIMCEQCFTDFINNYPEGKMRLMKEEAAGSPDHTNADLVEIGVDPS